MPKQYNKTPGCTGQKSTASIAVTVGVLALFAAADLLPGPVAPAAITAAAGCCGTLLLLVLDRRFDPAPLLEGVAFAAVTAASHLLEGIGLRHASIPLGQAVVAAMLLLEGGGSGLPWTGWMPPAAVVRTLAVALLCASALQVLLVAVAGAGAGPLWAVSAAAAVVAVALSRKAPAGPPGPLIELSSDRPGSVTATSGGILLCTFELSGEASLATVRSLVVSSDAAPWLVLDSVEAAAAGEGFAAVLVEGAPLAEEALLEAGYSRRDGGWHRVIPLAGRRISRPS